MKRLLTFLALCCLVVTGAWAASPSDDYSGSWYIKDAATGLYVANGPNRTTWQSELSTKSEGTVFTITPVEGGGYTIKDNRTKQNIGGAQLDNPENGDHGAMFDDLNWAPSWTITKVTDGIIFSTTPSGKNTRYITVNSSNHNDLTLLCEDPEQATVFVLENLPFVAASSVENITHWYALNINSNTSNYLSSNGSAIALSITYESTEAYAWGFVGDALNGYAVYNKATGTYISNVDPCALTSDAFKWEFAKGVNGSVFSSGGFCLGEPGKTGNSKYINLQSGALKRWNADNGSTFNAVELTLEEPETPDPVKATYTLNPAAGNVEASDLATITLAFTGDFEGVTSLSEEEMEDYVPSLKGESEFAWIESMTMNDEGNFEICFDTSDITEGEWTLTIPEGTFTTLDANAQPVPVAEITATYTVVSTPLTFEPEKLYTLKEEAEGRGNLAYNPAATGKVGLADVTYTGCADKHASSQNSEASIAFNIIEEPAGTVKFYCEKNNSYVKFSSTANGTVAEWTTDAAQATTFGFTEENGKYFFNPTGSEFYMNSCCGYGASDGPVRLDTKANTKAWTVAEYVAPEPTTYTYDITITGVPEGKTAELSYKGAPCGEQLETSGNIKKEDFTATEIPGYNVAIYINGDQINVVYTLENHIIEALDIIGLPEDYDRGIIVNGQRYLNTQISNVTPLVISGALDYEALPVPGYATTVEIYQTTIAGQNVSGLRVKYVVQKPLAYTSPTSYYVNIKSADGYLYNDRENDTKTLSNSASSTNNNYVWRVDVAEDGTMTITNGQGSHYTNESGTEKATFSAEDIETLGWTFEPVSFKYVTKILVAEEEGQGYVTLGDNRAYNNGFLMSNDINFHGLGYGDLSENTIAPRVGAGFEYAQKSVRPVVRLTYFTQEDVDENEPKMLERMVYWYNHIGKVGYPTGETLCLAYDEEYKAYYPNGENEYCENFIMNFWMPLEVYMSMGLVPTTSDYLKILSVFDKVSTENNIVLPIVGEGYRISVRTKSGEHKYLVADGKLTADITKASVFVLSKDEDRFFFASNDNTNLNYLTSEGEKTTAYNANSCAFTPFQMSLIDQDFTEDGDVTANPSERVGTFSLTVEGGTITLDDEDNWSLSDNAKMNDTYTSGFELEDIEYPYNKPKFAKGTPDGHAGGYASIWLPYPMKFADGVEVYKGTNVENENLLILTQVNTDEVVAAGGYILCNLGQSDDTVTQLVLPAAADPESKIEETDKNVFYGSTENPLVVKEEGSWAAFREQHPSGTPYVLAKKNGIVGYYKYTDEEYLPKGKAIWFSNYTSDAECVQFSFGDIISAIEALHGNTGDNEIFDLQGRRLDKAEKGQVNVINGKKVMFK